MDSRLADGTQLRLAGLRASYFETGGRPNSRDLDEIIALQREVIGSRLHLIASACYPFDSVLKALAEPSFVLPVDGLPGDRYLPGAGVMDHVEEVGQDLVLDLFDRPAGYHVTLQPHSGTQANQIVFNAVLQPEDAVLCLRPRDGGHISHTVLLSRRHQTINYGLTSAGYINYDEMRALALKHRPRLIIVGGSSLTRAIDFATCAEIAQAAGALLHADVSHTATFIAAGLHPSAFPHCDFLTFNCMKNLRGPNGGMLAYRSDFRSQVVRALFPTTQGGPNESGLLGKFACLHEWQHRSIADYASNVVSSARVIAQSLEQHGISLVSGGTDCHMLLLDLRDTSLSGADAERRLELRRVLANRNLVPGDSRTPRVTSGLRIGATNLAILNYEQADLQLLAAFLARVVSSPGDSSIETVEYLVKKYQSHLITPMW